MNIKEGGKIGSQEIRLYNLIWKNTIESLMEKQYMNQLQRDISAPEKSKYINIKLKKLFLKVGKF